LVEVQKMLGGESLQNQRRRGFSLIELLIVVAIILIIAAIAIPNLLRARMAANESSAVSSVRTINTAEITYQSTYPGAGYSTSLGALGNSSSGTCSAPTATQACLIDYSLANATASTTPKSGYYFGYAAGSGNVSYTVGGVAAKFNQTGVRSFCSTEDAVIRQSVPSSQATPTTTATTCDGWTPLQ
jgi:type IV pilus assembly protein PilA